MKKVTVLPRDDGHDFNQSWMVHVSGKMKSNHTTKQAAKNAAREYANEGDTLEIRRTDGSIQERKTVQNGSSSSGESEKSSAFGIPGFGDADYGKGTMEVNDLF